ncbi:VIT domain-containing protein, partial [Candidatus Moduliflexota bacterium]
MTMIETTQETTSEEQAGLLTPDGTSIPLLGVSIKGRLQGRAFELKVAQRYRNTGTDPLEAVYLFPLPEDATVCGLTVRTGDRVLTGEVDERERAFDRYDEAMSEGDGAVLLDQERPNVYQLSVGNVLPGQEVIVEIR